MKKTLLLLLLVITLLPARAQWVTIPDTNFVTFLQSQGLGACLNGNQMDTTCPAIVNANGLTAMTFKGITSLEGIQYFDNLNYLFFYADSISYLPAFPPNLKDLRLDVTLLTDLPPLPNGLNSLICGNNAYLNLPQPLPASLKTVSWAANLSMDTIPLLPDSVTWAEFSGLGASVMLAPLPPHLTNLTCTNNQLTQLPALPLSLQSLDCENNQLSSLPALPNATLVRCGNNQLTALPVLSDSLTDLWLGGNQFTTIPSLPALVNWLVVSDNPLTYLPALPAGLNNLQCNNTQLQYLPDLPDHLTYLYIQDNTSLHCLPELKAIDYLFWDSSAVHCLPSIPQGLIQATPPISNMPLCDVTNPDNCSIYYNINGTLYRDSISNCVNDLSESRIQHLKLQLSQSGNVLQQGYFSEAYSFNTGLGTFQTSVDTTGLPFNITCPVSNSQTSVLTALDSIDTGINFGIECKPGSDIAVWSLVSLDAFRPASTPTLYIKAGDWASFWGQRCNTQLQPGTLQLVINGPATFLAPALGALFPSIVSGSGQIVTYGFGDLSAINPETAFNMILKVDTTAQPSQSICLTVSVAINAPDNNPYNNQVSTCMPVVASLDPNDKTASPATGIPQDGWLTYTIRFQNTGNSYAQNVYILDTLDANIDASSFQLLSWSHENQTTLSDNIVRFSFPNINLPDSNTNEPQSHGYVQYKVKAKDNLPIGTHIQNTASIYFDFNAPVVTNTTDNFGCPVDFTQLNQTICSGDTFTFNGQQLTQAGSYADTLPNQSGCDSIIALQLQLYPAIPPTTVNATICQGDTFWLETTPYSTSGNYSYAFQSMYGCDSVVDLNLIVDELPHANLSSDCETTGSNPPIICGWCGALFLNLYNIDSVKWEIHPQCCGHDTTIYNADTLSLFTDYPSYCVPSDAYFEVPMGPSIYVCVTAYNKCGITNYCDTVVLWPESINETTINNFQLFPNPAKDYISISTEESAIGGELQIRDITGRLITTQKVTSKQFSLNTLELNSGIYLLSLREQSGAIGVKRLVIE